MFVDCVVCVQQAILYNNNTNNIINNNNNNTFFFVVCVSDDYCMLFMLNRLSYVVILKFKILNKKCNIKLFWAVRKMLLHSPPAGAITFPQCLKSHLPHCNISIIHLSLVTRYS